MNDVQVRPATIKDVPSIMPLWNELMALHERLDPSFAMCKDAARKFQAFLEENITGGTDDKFVLVASIAGNPAALTGYCMGGISERPPVFNTIRVGFVWDILVTSAARRRHVGQALVQHARTWFVARGITRVELHAATANPVSQAFWRSQAFKPYMSVMHLELDEP